MSKQPTEKKPTKPAQRRVRRVVSLLVILALLAVVWRFGWPEIKARISPTEQSLAHIQASGVIQTDEIEIASQTSTRISALLVHEGDIVAAGDTVVQLDTTTLDVQIEAARAAVSLAQATLEQARAGVRPTQIAVAQAELAQAQTAHMAAAQAVSDTLALVENPQEMRMQIAVQQAQLEAERHRLAQKLALKDAAEIARDAFQDAQAKIQDAGGPGQHKIQTPQGVIVYTVPSLPLDAHLAPNTWWQAWAGVNAADAQVGGMEAALAHLQARRQHPQELEAQADLARGTEAQAQARVAAAQARVNALQAGAPQEQLAALQARVDQAQAALDTLLSQKTQLTLETPLSGVVTNVKAHYGEVAAPGATLLTVADLSQMRLIVYLAEPQIGKVQLGQPVQVSVDSFSDRVFDGTVTHIADRAEFTPRNVATQQERVNLVYAIEIRVPNQDGALKPGMPADVVFEGMERDQ